MISTVLVAVLSDSLGSRFEGHAVIISYLRVASSFAWPVVVLVFVMMFRRQIGGFIDRLRELGVAGARVRAQAPRAQVAVEPARPGDIPPNVVGGPEGVVVQFAEQHLRVNLRLDQQPDLQQQVRMLLNTAAGFNVA